MLLASLKTTLEGDDAGGRGEISLAWRRERIELGSVSTYAALGAIAGLMLAGLIGLGALTVPLVLVGLGAGIAARVGLGRALQATLREERATAERNLLADKETALQRQLARARASGGFGQREQ